MLSATTVVVIAGAFAGGFVSGLAGFGTGLVSLGIWLYVLTPSSASTLVVVCSVISQLQTIPAVWKAIDLRRLWPMLLAGLIGVPAGTLLLAHANPTHFKLGMGIVLVVFSAFMLHGSYKTRLTWGGRAADGVIGFFGGILGGLAGLSGPLPTMWAALRGWGKDERRGVFQAFNSTILIAAIVTHAASGFLTWEFGKLLLVALPGTLVGAWLGLRTYRRLTDIQFNKVVYYLLASSGVTLLASSTWSVLAPG